MKRKIKHDYGMGDYYQYFTDTTDHDISKTQFNKVITEFNLALQELIIRDNVIYQMPGINFEIVLKKEKRKPRIKDGKLYNPLPIDWARTNKLWEKDEEAKEKKLLVRINNSHTSGHVFRIYCKKFKSTSKNRGLYRWKTIRQFARRLKTGLKNPDNDIDAYLLY